MGNKDFYLYNRSKYTHGQWKLLNGGPYTASDVHAWHRGISQQYPDNEFLAYEIDKGKGPPTTLDENFTDLATPV